MYGEHCAGCHAGKGEQQLSYFPDLHRMPAERHATFENIVLGGLLSNVGMASFADVLSKDDALAIHSYLIREQRKLFVALSNAQPTKEN